MTTLVPSALVAQLGFKFVFPGLFRRLAPNFEIRSRPSDTFISSVGALERPTLDSATNNSEYVIFNLTIRRNIPKETHHSRFRR